LVYALSAALAIWGKRHRKRRLAHWLFKPLATGWLLYMAILMMGPSSARPWVQGALCCSLLGDIALMAKSRWLPVGLGAFLAAVCCYVVAFSTETPWTLAQTAYLILPAAVGAAVLRGLWRDLGAKVAGLRWAVLFYVAALVTLMWRALSRFDSLDISLSAWLWGCAGATLFFIGDTLLARRRFAERPAPYALELGSYYAAQWCLVMALL
jgi:uncharacterized membrane protein YhhN